jgi:hypothetical protein
MIGARFAPNVPQAQKSFWSHAMELLVEGYVESHFGTFGVSMSVQYMFIVCAKHTIGSENILDAPDVTPC